MLGIILRDRKRNTWIRQETGDIINAIRKVKHRWAGHIARLSGPSGQQSGPKEIGRQNNRGSMDIKNKV